MQHFPITLNGVDVVTPGGSNLFLNQNAPPTVNVSVVKTLGLGTRLFTKCIKMAKQEKSRTERCWKKTGLAVHY